jgi:hypothetical protein
MGLAFFCGFDSFSTGTADMRKFFYRGEIQAGGGAFGGKRLYASGANIQSQAWRIGAANAIPANYAAGWLCAGHLGFGTAERNAAYVYADGRCGIRINSSNATVEVQFSAFTLPAWVEVGCLDGKTEIWVNGLLRLSHPVEIAQNLHPTALGYGTDGLYADDLVFWNSDATGDGFDTFPLGPQRIATLQNTGSGSSTEWAAASGENWAATTAATWSGGAGVTADEAGLTDMYRVGPLPWNSSRIRAVQQWVSGMSDTGGGAIQLVGNVGETPFESSPLPLPLVSPEIQIGPQFGVDGYPPSILETAEFGFRST